MAIDVFFNEIITSISLCVTGELLAFTDENSVVTLTMHARSDFESDYAHLVGATVYDALSFFA